MFFFGFRRKNDEHEEAMSNTIGLDGRQLFTRPTLLYSFKAYRSP
jgi:hypothetical protein